MLCLVFQETNPICVEFDVNAPGFPPLLFQDEKFPDVRLPDRGK